MPSSAVGLVFHGQVMQVGQVEHVKGHHRGGGRVPRGRPILLYVPPAVPPYVHVFLVGIVGMVMPVM